MPRKAKPAEDQPRNSAKGKRKTPVGRPFVKGQSGNPGGRPKGRSLTSLIREVLDSDAPGGQRSVAEQLAAKIVQLALKGRFDAIALVMERTDGKVTQPVDLTSKGQQVQTHIYLPDNGRDARPGDSGDPAAAGPAGDVPLDAG